MFTKLGIFSFLAGLFLGVFTGISSFMENQGFWVGLTISKIIGEDNSESIIGLIDVALVQNLLDYMLYELPFFAFLIGIGIFSLIISLFEKSH